MCLQDFSFVDNKARMLLTPWGRVSQLAMTAAFICEMQVRNLVQVDLKEAYFIKIGPWSSLHHLWQGWLYNTGATPQLANRYHRQRNKCSGVKSVFLQRPFGTLPKGWSQPISTLPALQSVMFLCSCTHDVMPPYKSRCASELLALDVQLLE